MTEAKSSGIPSLATTTFDSWERTIRGHCMQHGLIQFFHASTPPGDVASRAVYDTNCTKTAGIFIQYMGDDNFNRLKATQPPLDREDPAVIWKFLTDHYQSTTSDNQSKVYHDYNLFSFQGDLETFLLDLDKHLGHLAAVGFVIGEPIGAVIKEAIFAKSIVDKLPDRYDTVKDLLWAQRPLTIKIVRDTLQNKSRNTTSTFNGLSAPLVKSEDAALTVEKTKKLWCRPGFHSPTASHTEQECRQLKVKKKPAAKKAIAPPEDQNDNESIATAEGLRCTARISVMPEESKLVYLDSGASHHMFSQKEVFVDYSTRNTRVEIADGNTLSVVGQGFVPIVAANGSIIRLKALHVPRLNAPLVSLGRLLEHNCIISNCTANGFDVKLNGDTIMSTVMVNSTPRISIRFANHGEPDTPTERL